MLRPIWNAFSRKNMLQSIFAKESLQIRARRWAPKQPHHRNNAPQPPKPASGNERAIKPGGPGGLPLALFLPISREKWGPPPGRRGPRGAAPRGTGKAPTTRRVRSTLPHPRPGPGGKTTSQGWTCDGPRPDHLPLPPQLFQHSCSTSARTRQAWSQFSWAWSQKSCRRQGSSVASAPAR